MKFSKKIINEIKPKNYVKPPIEVESYFLDWNEVSFGIPSDESSELKIFIKDSIPMLGVLLNQAKQIQRIGEKNKKLDRIDLSHTYTPMLSLSHMANGADYTIIMNWDGEIFVDREEDIRKKIEKQGKETGGYCDSQMHVRWNLGQLHKKLSDH